MRSGGTIQSRLPGVVMRVTKSTIDCLAAPSFHDGKGSPCAQEGNTRQRGRRCDDTADERSTPHCPSSCVHDRSRKTCGPNRIRSCIGAWLECGLRPSRRRDDRKPLRPLRTHRQSPIDDGHDNRATRPIRPASPALAGRRGLLHAVARHHDPQHRGAGHRAGDGRDAAQREVGAGELYAEPRGVHPGERLDGRPLRHAARVRRGDRAVHPGLGAVRSRDQHRDAGRLPRRAGHGRRHDDAGRTHDAGPHLRQGRAGARHELRRHPEPGRPDGGSRGRRADRHLSRLARRVLRQRAGRPARPLLRAALPARLSRAEEPSRSTSPGLVLFGGGIALLSYVLEVFGDHTPRRHRDRWCCWRSRRRCSRATASAPADAPFPCSISACSGCALSARR